MTEERKKDQSGYKQWNKTVLIVLLVFGLSSAFHRTVHTVLVFISEEAYWEVREQALRQ